MPDAVRRLPDAMSLPIENSSGASVPRSIELVLLAQDTLSITAMAQNIPRPKAAGTSCLASSIRAADLRRASTGARVTLEFSVTVPFPKERDVRLLYDFAGNGTWRECVGVPKLTHIMQGPSIYHYRMSHWISSQDIERFAQR
jgi:hypothetical protein